VIRTFLPRPRHPSPTRRSPFLRNTAPYLQRERQQDHQTASTIEKGHGRVERRTLTSSTRLNAHLDWPHVGHVCQIRRERTVGGTTSVEVAYCVMSLPRSRASAERLLALARDHGGAIENGLHYVRDEAFGEDNSPIFRGDALKTWPPSATPASTACGNSKSTTSPSPSAASPGIPNASSATRTKRWPCGSKQGDL